MRAIVLAMVIAAGSALGSAAPSRTGADAAIVDSLQAALRRKLAADDAADGGIFHNDVTSLVAPYFAIGATLAEAQRVLDEQGLPPLRKFHGMPDRDGETIFVSRVELRTQSQFDVHAVLDFDFDGARDEDLHLRKVTAYLQASSM